MEDIINLIVAVRSRSKSINLIVQEYIIDSFVNKKKLVVDKTIDASELKKQKERDRRRRYRESHKQEIKEYSKQYKELNRDKLNAQQNVRCREIREEDYTKHIAKKRAYYEANKERIRTYNAELKAKKDPKYLCTCCNYYINTSSKSRHDELMKLRDYGRKELCRYCRTYVDKTELVEHDKKCSHSKSV